MRADEHPDGVVLHTRGDRAVAELARRQHGVVSAAQLRGAGLQRGAVALRIREGRLHAVQRGVYAVGHTVLSQRGRLWAAVLAAGGPTRAAVSHRSAAGVWDLAPANGRRVELITLAESHARSGLRVHRSRSLKPARDVVLEPDGLPVTTVARTLVDLAGALDAHRLERAVHRAETLRLLDVAPMLTPRTNVGVAGFEVDCLWPEHRLVVELDGAATHRTPTAFVADRRRDAVLQVARYRVVRFTWQDVGQRPGYVVATLTALLQATT